jgi:hypothetical protein
MLDVLEALLPEAFVALDLACGPGAISQRLLARFPHARCVAVDLDPVLLTMGQSVLGTMETFQRVADTVKARRQEEAFTRRGGEDWTTWWQALSAEPALQDLFTERERRFTWKAQERRVPIFDVHEAALRDAGFREVGVIWQNMDNRVLMAVR